MTREQLLEYYRSLSAEQRIETLLEQERVKARVEAAQAALLSVIDEDPAIELSSPRLDPRTALDKGWVREEVACALRIAHQTARARLVNAQILLERYPATWDLLHAGQIGYLHVRNLLEATSNLDPAVATQVEQAVLPAAADQTPAEFRRALKKTVARLDPTGEAERHERAAADRRVEHFPGEDGMATIWALLPAPDAQAIMTALDGLAGRVSADDPRTMDQRRADALTDLALDALDRCPTRHGRKPAVQVTVALSTLLGVDEQAGELAGYGPVCAELARQLAFDPTGTWTRLITDDCGRLVDLGTTKYRPPQVLTDFVIARDQICRMPGCNRKACSCELDHVTPWPAGPTCAANLHALCCRHHKIKHEAGWQVTRGPDGTTIWITPTGRRYTKPPWTYPLDTTLDPPEHRGETAA